MAAPVPLTTGPHQNNTTRNTASWSFGGVDGSHGYALWTSDATISNLSELSDSPTGCRQFYTSLAFRCCQAENQAFEPQTHSTRASVCILSHCWGMEAARSTKRTDDPQNTKLCLTTLYELKDLDNFYRGKFYPLLSQPMLIIGQLSINHCAKHWSQDGEPGSHGPAIVGLTFYWNNINSSHWLNVYYESNIFLCNLHGFTHLILLTREWFLLLYPFYRWGNRERQKLSTLPWDIWEISSGTRISDAMSWSQELTLKENILLIFSVFSLSSPYLHQVAVIFYPTFKKKEHVFIQWNSMLGFWFPTE